MCYTTEAHTIMTTGIAKTLVGTDVIEYSMTARTALGIGLLTDGAEGCAWFAEWARKTPEDTVYVYTFGGFIGGFVYGSRADFDTLSEFAEQADASAQRVWQELREMWFDALIVYGVF